MTEVQDDAKVLFANFFPIETRWQAKDSPFYWVLKAPTMKEEALMAEWMSTNEKPLVVLIAIHELALTFGGTNLPALSSPTNDPGDPEFVPALKRDATREEIVAYLSAIPAGVVLRIWAEVRTVAPHWGPQFR